MIQQKGIDVSAHQGRIDWKNVKESGIQFAILRAGYGNHLSQKDSQFERNYQEARKQGLPVGAYWFSYATSVEDAKKEAQVCCQVLRGHTLQYPVFFDFEYDSVRYAKEQGVTITKAMATAFAKAFLAEIQKSGYRAGNYANLDYLHNYFDQNALAPYDLWLAAWETSKPPYNMAIWQYSDKGSVPGITGSVDVNYAYVDYAKDAKNSTATAPAPTKKTAVTTANVRLRKDAHTAAKILAVVPKGKQVTLLSDDNWGWSRVRFGTLTGWMSNEFLQGTGLSRYHTGICHGANVNVRKGPSLESVVAGQLQQGESFLVISILPNGWLHIRKNDREGYVYYDKSYLTVKG